MNIQDKKYERAAERGAIAGLILGTIRKGNPNSIRLLRPVKYGVGGSLAGGALYQASKILHEKKQRG